MKLAGLFVVGVALASLPCAAQTKQIRIREGASSAAVVTFQEPTGTTGTSPLQVAASINAPVHVLQLYVDGVKSAEVFTTALSASVTLPVGTHRLAVQAMDSNNVVTKAVKYVTITTPPPPPTSGTSFTNLQESSSWQTCGSCGNQKGTTAEATYSMTRGITSPAIDNTATSAEFQIGGTYRYTDAYWYLEHPAPSSAFKSLTYDFWIYVPESSAKAPQAVEFECQQTVNGYTYNYAWQADYGSHTWRTFDYTNRVWVPTIIPFTGFTPGTWHHIVAQSHASGTNTVHDSLTVDGVLTTVSITRPALQTGAGNQFTNAFQLDLNGVPTPYSVFVDKMNVTYQ